MSVSTPIQSFGIHQITMSLLSDPSIIGNAKIVGDTTPEITQELVDNRGGSQAFPWASAPGDADGAIPTIIKQYDKNILRILNPYIAGSIVENETGDADGDVSGLVNVIGTSVFDAAAGIASVAVDAATKDVLAYGEYIIKAVAAGTFDLYLDTDVSGLAPYVDDTLKINSTPITNPGTGGTVIYQGIEFTAGSSAAAMTIGDMARISVRPANAYSLIHYIHKQGAAAQEFSIMIATELVGNKIRVIRFPRCIADGAAGLKPVRKEWAMIEANIKILAPSSVDYVGKQEFINR